MFGKQKRSRSSEDNGIHEVELPGGDVQKESTEDVVRDSVEVRSRLSADDQFSALEEEYAERLPQNWDEMNMSAKLDWFGHRILLDLREETGREATRDWGFLSDYQLERRRRREVQSKLIGGWDDLPPRQGVFRRVHVDKNNLLTGDNKTKPEDKKPGGNDGQKN
jgi:hypothetical protein